MELSDITSIGRTMDFDYATNRAITAVTILVAVGGALLQRLSGAAWIESALWGVNAGLTVFLAWVVGRELDPDHPMAAFVAVALVLPAFYVWDLPQLSVILWLVIVMRVVNRSAGRRAGVVDALGLLGLAGWLSLQGNWGFGVITALTFFLDAQLPKGADRHKAFALVAMVVTVAIAIVGAVPAGPDGPSLMGGLIALGLSLVFLPVLLAARHVQSVGDQTGEPLSPIRVRTAQALALLAGVEVGFVGGVPALKALSPLWAATLGAAITWLANTVREANG